jgi:hypothetical protein
MESINRNRPKSLFFSKPGAASYVQIVPVAIQRLVVGVALILLLLFYPLNVAVALE